MKAACLSLQENAKSVLSRIQVRVVTKIDDVFAGGADNAVPLAEQNSRRMSC